VVAAGADKTELAGSGDYSRGASPSRLPSRWSTTRRDQATALPWRRRISSLFRCADCRAHPEPFTGWGVRLPRTLELFLWASCGRRSRRGYGPVSAATPVDQSRGELNVFEGARNRLGREGYAISRRYALPDPCGYHSRPSSLGPRLPQGRHAMQKEKPRGGGWVCGALRAWMSSQSCWPAESHTVPLLTKDK
jgi:hypothetical protein